jgi:hypothetical protein
MSIECYKGECRYHQRDEPYCTMNDCQACPACEELDFFVLEPAMCNNISFIQCKFCGANLRIYLRQYTHLTLVQQL